MEQNLERFTNICKLSNTLFNNQWVKGEITKEIRKYLERNNSQESYPSPKVGAVAKRSYATSEVRGGGREVLPTTRGQGWQPGRATPRPRSSGCTGTGGPRGAIPR